MVVEMEEGGGKQKEQTGKDDIKNPRVRYATTYMYTCLTVLERYTCVCRFEGECP